MSNKIGVTISWIQDLGVVLVFNFVKKHLPDKESEVRMMFRKRGAYSRFSHWLDRHNLVDDWHRFRNQVTRQAIIDWCKDNDVQV